MSVVNISLENLSDSAYDAFWNLMNATYSYGDLPSVLDLRASVLGEMTALTTAAGAACVLAVGGIWTMCRRSAHAKKTDDAILKRKVLQLIKKASLPGCTQTIIEEINALNLDVNEKVSSSGLTFFLFGCLSGDAKLIKHMIDMGGDIKAETVEGDSALYLATYAVLHSDVHDATTALRLLIQAGKSCCVNQQNRRGYTPLHRAASRGHIKVIQFLLFEGADPYIANYAGVYPIDSAICAGHTDAASLLKLKLANPHVWDVVDPHTPPHIRMGLQSPQRKALLNSPRPSRPLRNFFT